MAESVFETSTGLEVFEECSLKFENSSESILLCMTDGLAKKHEAHVSNTNQWLLVLAGAMVFLMQLGFAMLCAGSVRRKNIANTLLKNLLDACGAAVAFYVLGYAFAFGGQDASNGFTFIGHADFCLSSGTVDLSFWFFQYAFSAASVTIIAGTLAERCRMSAYFSYSAFMAGFVYPVVVHAIWSENGFLSAFAGRPFGGIGSIDFAGSGVVHMTGGTTALVATWILGARKGRFDSDSISASGNPNTNRKKKEKPIPGHSIALQVLGGFILWFGWYGFNPGSALLLTATTDTGAVGALAATNTSLAAAVAAMSSLLLNTLLSVRRGELSFDLVKATNGALTGLVAITAGCGVVEPWAAIVIGIVAGGVYLGASALLVRLQLDDAVDAIPVHLFGGIVGMLAVGLMASPNRVAVAYGITGHAGVFYGSPTGHSAVLLGNQCLAIIFILGWALCLMTPFFVLLRRMNWLRVDAAEEIAGLDVSYHPATQEEHAAIRDAVLQEFRDFKVPGIDQDPEGPPSPRASPPSPTESPPLPPAPRSTVVYAET